jgi:hypothetical protein
MFIYQPIGTYAFYFVAYPWAAFDIPHVKKNVSGIWRNRLALFVLTNLTEGSAPIGANP